MLLFPPLITLLLFFAHKPENTVTVTVQNKQKPQKEKDISNDNDTPSFDF